MKKLLGISIVAVLAVTPLMANAATEAGKVTLIETNQQGNVAATNDVASTSYVKGAYNVLGGALNAIDTRVDDLETTVGDANSGLVKDTAALKTTVGDANSGLVKKVADLESGNGIAAGSIQLTQLATDVQTSLGKADNAADKDLSNLSNTGKGVITTEVTKNAASGTYSSTGTYANDTIGKALQGKQDIIPDLIEIRSGAAAGVTALQKADVTTGTEQMANGTISVGGTAVAVKGLKSAAFAETTDFDAAGTATTAKNAVETKLTTGGGANGYEIDAKTLKVQGTDVLTTGSSLNGGKITDGSVAKAALANNVQSSLDLADSALQEASIDTGTANGKIKVGTKEVSVYGLGSAAYANTDAFDAAGTAASAAATAEQNAKTYAKDYADAKLVTVHTTWGTDSATAPANVIVNPAQ